jgi:hypothetical protein
MLLMIISNNYLRWFNRRVRYGKTEGLAEETKVERDYKGGALISFVVLFC